MHMKETRRGEPGRSWRDWEFPGGHMLTLYTSTGHRASISLVDSKKRVMFYREYTYYELDLAREHAEGIASLGYTVAVAVMGESVIEGRLIA